MRSISEFSRAVWTGAGRRLRPTWSGLVGALLGLGAAMTPSLLPRPAMYLGVVAGAGTAIGYGVGVLVAWFLRKVEVPAAPATAQRWAWRILTFAGPVAAVLVVVLGTFAQEDVRVLVGEEPVRSHVFTVAVVALPFAVLLLAAGRGLRSAARWCARRLGRWVPAPVASVAGVVIVALLVYWLAAGVLFTAAVNVADTVYSGTNDTTDEGVTAPTSPLRSGSTASAVAWDTLGRQGRAFVAGGPSETQIAAYTGRTALEPIRVYVGINSRPTAHERAEQAVAELRRTGAFDRAVLVVAGATGTGWTEPQQVDAIEYMWGGDTAIVTTQYSYLPSWISFLVDADRAADAGRELFDAVHAAWAALPADHRPKLIVYGLSLGSFAAQAPFASTADIAARADGALFVGTPNFTPVWETVTRGRDAGSPEWQPVVEDGRTVRFGSSAADLARPAGEWSSPRIVYLQHASDPVVWWSPDLLTREPAWLSEARGPDVSPQSRWFPGITFLQVTIDQFFGVDVPDGHGHNYASQIVGAWAAVVPPAAWTDADTTRLQEHIDAVG